MTSPSQSLFLEAIAQYPQLPAPGSGQTLQRWQTLARWSSQDMGACKLAEAHWDALVILDDLQRSDLHAPVRRWGVWAAEHPQHRTILINRNSQPLLQGKKTWCTGADCVTHALMTCQDAQGQSWLVALDMASPGIRLQAQNWHNAGMRHAATYEIDFDHTPVSLIGPRSQYLQRPGFWHGGAGIAACWYGATTAVANVLRSKLDTAQPHASAHLGAMFIQLSAARAMLHTLAARIDAAPHDMHLEHVYAVRAQVREVATQVMERSARALGPAPLCMHTEHAQRCADLAIWCTQQHAEKDWEQLGHMVRQGDVSWTL